MSVTRVGPTLFKVVSEEAIAYYSYLDFTTATRLEIQYGISLF